jgi:ribosomal protein S18 acetylase RimI-like enzyme
MVVAIRTATIADRAALTAFGRRTFHETFAGQNTVGDMQTYLDAAFNERQQTTELTDPDRITLLAESDGVLVGYAQIRRGVPEPCVVERDSVELVRLYVDRDLQGHGVAQQLLQVAEASAATAARGMWLGVWERNARAIAFYTRCGYAIVGSHPFRLGEDLQTDHVMAKRASRRIGEPRVDSAPGQRKSSVATFTGVPI